MPEVLEKLDVSLEVNGEPVRVAVSHDSTLLDALRDELELTGTKRGCGEGECGSCSVLLNDKIVNSCLVLAAECAGARIVTIEGLAREGRLHPMQEAFVRHGAIQCGFCTPGMIMAGFSLLKENPSPSEAEVKRALEGNLCRCTGYRKIIDAVLSAASGGPRRD